MYNKNENSVWWKSVKRLVEIRNTNLDDAARRGCKWAGECNCRKIQINLNLLLAGNRSCLMIRGMNMLAISYAVTGHLRILLKWNPNCTNIVNRKSLSRLWLSCHKLQIEIDRYFLV